MGAVLQPVLNAPYSSHITEKKLWVRYGRPSVAIPPLACSKGLLHPTFNRNCNVPVTHGTLTVTPIT